MGLFPTNTTSELFNNNLFASSKGPNLFRDNLFEPQETYKSPKQSFNVKYSPDSYYNKSQELFNLPNTKQFIGELESRRAQYAPIPEATPAGKRSTWDRISNTFYLLEYPIAGTLEGLVTGAKTSANPFKILHKAVQGFAKGIAASNPLGGGYYEGRVTYTDLLNAIHEPTTKAGTTIQNTVGFALSIAADPLSYMPFGIGAMLKGTGAAAKGTKLTKEAADAIVRKKLKDSKIKLSDEQIALDVEALVSTTNKVLGHHNKTDGIEIGVKYFPFGEKIFPKLADKTKVLISGEELRGAADQSTSRLYYWARDKAYESSLVNKLSTKARLYGPAKSGEYTKIYEDIIAKTMSKGNRVGKADHEREITKVINELMRDATPADRKAIIEIMSDKTFFTKDFRFSPIKSTAEGQALIKNLQNKVAKLKDELNLKTVEYKKAKAIIEGGIEKQSKALVEMDNAKYAQDVAAIEREYVSAVKAIESNIREIEGKMLTTYERLKRAEKIDMKRFSQDIYNDIVEKSKDLTHPEYKAIEKKPIPGLSKSASRRTVAKYIAIDELNAILFPDAKEPVIVGATLPAKVKEVLVMLKRGDSLDYIRDHIFKFKDAYNGRWQWYADYVNKQFGMSGGLQKWRTQTEKYIVDNVYDVLNTMLANRYELQPNWVKKFPNFVEENFYRYIETNKLEHIKEFVEVPKNKRKIDKLFKEQQRAIKEDSVGEFLSQQKHFNTDTYVQMPLDAEDVYGNTPLISTGGKGGWDYVERVNLSKTLSEFVDTIRVGKGDSTPKRPSIEVLHVDTDGKALVKFKNAERPRKAPLKVSKGASASEMADKLNAKSAVERFLINNEGLSPSFRISRGEFTVPVKADTDKLHHIDKGGNIEVGVVSKLRRIEGVVAAAKRQERRRGQMMSSFARKSDEEISNIVDRELLDDVSDAYMHGENERAMLGYLDDESHLKFLADSEIEHSDKYGEVTTETVRKKIVDKDVLYDFIPNNAELNIVPDAGVVGKLSSSEIQALQSDIEKVKSEILTGSAEKLKKVAKLKTFTFNVDDLTVSFTKEPDSHVFDLISKVFDNHNIPYKLNHIKYDTFDVTIKPRSTSIKELSRELEKSERLSVYNMVDEKINLLSERYGKDVVIKKEVIVKIKRDAIDFVEDKLYRDFYAPLSELGDGEMYYLKDALFSFVEEKVALELAAVGGKQATAVSRELRVRVAKHTKLLKESEKLNAERLAKQVEESPKKLEEIRYDYRLRSEEVEGDLINAAIKAQEDLENVAIEKRLKLIELADEYKLKRANAIKAAEEAVAKEKELEVAALIENRSAALSEVERIADEIKELQEIIDDADLFELYASMNMGNYTRVVEDSYREIDRWVLTSKADNYSEEARKVAEYLTNSLYKFIKAESKIGVMAPDAVRFFIDDYLPRIATPKMTEFLKSKSATKGKYVHITDDLGFGVKYNEFKHNKPPKIEIDGEIIENPTIAQLNEYYKPLLHGAKAFEDDIANIFILRAMKHSDLLYDEKYTYELMELIGHEIGEAVDEGYTAVIQHGMLKKAVWASAKQRTALELMRNPSLSNNKTLRLAHTKAACDDILKELGFDEKVFGAFATPMVELNSVQLKNLMTFLSGGTEEATVRSKHVRQVQTGIVNSMNQARKLAIQRDASSFLRLWDTITHLWKLNVTAILPSFHVRNKISNQFNNHFIIGADILDPTLQKETFKAIISRGGNNLEFRVNVKQANGKYVTKTIKEMYDDAVREGVIDVGYYGVDLGIELRSSGVANKVTSWIESKGKKSIRNRLARLDPTDSINFLPYEIGTNVGSITENHDKFLHYVAMLRSGKTSSEAARSAISSLFDYGDLTFFEQSVMKRVIPFYTWFRKNSMYQLDMLVEHPEAYYRLTKILTGIENLVPEDERVRNVDRPDFLQDFVQLPIIVGDDPVYWNTGLPHMELSDIPIPWDAKESARVMMTKSNPLIKIPLEQLFDYSFFFDDKLLNSKGGDSTSERAKHVLRQLAVYNKVERAGRTSGEKRALGILADLTGLKLLPYDATK